MECILNFLNSISTAIRIIIKARSVMPIIFKNSIALTPELKVNSISSVHIANKIVNKIKFNKAIIRYLIDFFSMNSTIYPLSVILSSCFIFTVGIFTISKVAEAKITFPSVAKIWVPISSFKRCLVNLLFL